jgi:hypothetical protein
MDMTYLRWRTHRTCVQSQGSLGTIKQCHWELSKSTCPWGISGGEFLQAPRRGFKGSKGNKGNAAGQGREGRLPALIRCVLSVEASLEQHGDRKEEGGCDGDQRSTLGEERSCDIVR